MTDDRLEGLYRRLGPLLYARCKRVLRDAALAEDATQEVFMKLAPRLTPGLDDAAAVALLYRISTHHCLDLLRRRAVRSGMPALATPSVDPREALHDRALLLQLLAHMPEKLRAPALLYHLDGLEQTEVAAVLQISRRTVINRLAEFGERVRKFIQREVP